MLAFRRRAVHFSTKNNVKEEIAAALTPKARILETRKAKNSTLQKDQSGLLKSGSGKRCTSLAREDRKGILRKTSLRVPPSTFLLTPKREGSTDVEWGR